MQRDYGKHYAGQVTSILLDYLKSRHEEFSVNDIIEILDITKEKVLNMPTERFEGVGEGVSENYKEYP